MVRIEATMYLSMKGTVCTRVLVRGETMEEQESELQWEYEATGVDEALEMLGSEVCKAMDEYEETSEDD